MAADAPQLIRAEDRSLPPLADEGQWCPRCAGTGSDPDALDIDGLVEQPPAICPTCGGSGTVPDEQTEMFAL